MAQFIIHKDGVYNLWTSVADGPCYESGLTLEQLRELLIPKQEPTGDERLDKMIEEVEELKFKNRLDRAHAKGTSARLYDSLEDLLKINHAGPYGSCMPVDEVIKKYLTI